MDDKLGDLVGIQGVGFVNEKVAAIWVSINLGQKNTNMRRSQN